MLKGLLLKYYCLQLQHHILWAPLMKLAAAHESHQRSSPNSSRLFCIHPLPKPNLFADHPLSSLIADEAGRKISLLKRKTSKYPYTINSITFSVETKNINEVPQISSEERLAFHASPLSFPIKLFPK